VYLDVIYLKGIFDITFARRAEWGHVNHASRLATETSGTHSPVEVSS